MPLPLKQQAQECSTRPIPVLGQDELECVSAALWKIDPKAPMVAAVSKGFMFAVDTVSKYPSSIDMLGGHARIRVGSKPSLDPSRDQGGRRPPTGDRDTGRGANLGEVSIHPPN